MKLELHNLSRDDGFDVYEMLNCINSEENHFTNPVRGMTYDQFKTWLKQQEQWSLGKSLPDGYSRQRIYWLYMGGRPVGFGKLRFELTDQLRDNGGNIGYAIAPEYRGYGLGTVFLRLLIEEAKREGITEVLLTIDKSNRASVRVAERNGCVLISENSNRYYYGRSIR